MICVWDYFMPLTEEREHGSGQLLIMPFPFNGDASVMSKSMYITSSWCCVEDSSPSRFRHLSLFWPQWGYLGTVVPSYCWASSLFTLSISVEYSWELVIVCSLHTGSFEDVLFFQVWKIYLIPPLCFDSEFGQNFLCPANGYRSPICSGSFSPAFWSIEQCGHSHDAVELENDLHCGHYQ
jgi:hypothetical protein